MEIPPEFKPTDPIQRRRQAEQAARPAAGEATAAKAPPQGKPADSAAVGQGFDPASVEKFVGVLKTMNPLSLHKVEDLRQRIADGSYGADADELADLLLGDEPRPGDAPRGPKPGA
jgi:anti-sigma28 factor (negative regulator of flagellin synthesis)